MIIIIKKILKITKITTKNKLKAKVIWNNLKVII